ncbi:hypothetical protein NDU88_012194 [Pleurodeles waltl]|uniref:Uncharacterized protein n=1 Tax=Pleurodeles waltl TaxID=8319 RepID=A0AAV7QZF7_PLEWA|nr:hypothetical protein NDU88_012194 [Pleurodeles waltl]
MAGPERVLARFLVPPVVRVRILRLLAGLFRVVLLSAPLCVYAFAFVFSLGCSVLSFDSLLIPEIRVCVTDAGPPVVMVTRDAVRASSTILPWEPRRRTASYTILLPSSANAHNDPGQPNLVGVVWYSQTTDDPCLEEGYWALFLRRPTHA